jgi:hypothetical protein
MNLKGKKRGSTNWGAGREGRYSGPLAANAKVIREPCIGSPQAQTGLREIGPPLVASVYQRNQ